MLQPKATGWLLHQLRGAGGQSLEGPRARLLPVDCLPATWRAASLLPVLKCQSWLVPHSPLFKVRSLWENPDFPTPPFALSPQWGWPPKPLWEQGGSWEVGARSTHSVGSLGQPSPALGQAGLSGPSGARLSSGSPGAVLAGSLR